jgi:hypothetical protein
LRLALKTRPRDTRHRREVTRPGQIRFKRSARIHRLV